MGFLAHQQPVSQGCHAEHLIRVKPHGWNIAKLNIPITTEPIIYINMRYIPSVRMMPYSRGVMDPSCRKAMRRKVIFKRV